MNCEEANKISIIGFLDSLGIKPVKTTGNSYWYNSPLRKEKTPSFKVDGRLNRWYDHGIAEGGKLVDLGTRLLSVDIPALLEKLSSQSIASFSFQQPEVHEPAYFQIQKIKDLNNKALTSYLDQRAIPLSVAKEFCWEIYYEIQGKKYFAIGFENDSKGYEIRNKYFKACIGAKDITTIQNDSTERVALFEGFIDFLSWVKQLQAKMSRSSFIVLNSVNQIEKAKAKLLQLNPKIIEAYFDNDAAGRKCFEALVKDFPSAIDRSSLYKGLKDVNEMVVRSKELNQGFSI